MLFYRFLTQKPKEMHLENSLKLFMLEFDSIIDRWYACQLKKTKGVHMLFG